MDNVFMWVGFIATVQTIILGIIGVIVAVCFLIDEIRKPGWHWTVLWYAWMVFWAVVGVVGFTYLLITLYIPVIF